MKRNTGWNYAMFFLSAGLTAIAFYDRIVLGEPLTFLDGLIATNALWCASDLFRSWAYHELHPQEQTTR